MAHSSKPPLGTNKSANSFYFHLAARAATGVDYTIAARQLRLEGLAHDALPQTAKVTPFLDPDYNLRFKLLLKSSHHHQRTIEVVRQPVPNTAYLPLVAQHPVRGSVATHGFRQAAQEILAIRAEPPHVTATVFAGLVYFRMPKPAAHSPLQWLKNLATPRPILALTPEIFGQFYQRRIDAPAVPTGNVMAFAPRKQPLNKPT